MTTALLLSGGVDSIALLVWKKPSLAITVDYGQIPARAEIEAARSACRQTGVPHAEIHANCSQVGSGCMAPDNATPSVDSVTPEWWPFRNQLLVTLGASYAISHGVQMLLIGTVASDRVHLDGTPAFVETMNDLLHLQEGSLKLKAPAMEMRTAELVLVSGASRSLLAWSHSCHCSNDACGKCRGCTKNSEVLRELGWE